MKKLIVFFVVFVFILSGCAAPATSTPSAASEPTAQETHGNYTDEMKITT